jgi:hypothetical protein
VVRPETLNDPTESAQGYRKVYSATDEFNDGGLAYYSHSSYLIYRSDGKLFKTVENHMSRSDEIAERVSLPAGSYIVEAPITKQRIRPRSRGDQAESAEAPRLGFERQRIIQRDSAQLSVRKSSQSFTKDRSRQSNGTHNGLNRDQCLAD